MAKGKTKESKVSTPNKKTKTTDNDEDATITQLLNDQPKNKQKKNEKVNLEGENQEGYVNCSLPMSRIKRIVKSEGSAIHVSQDSIFLINKASEKFLELFSKEAYACATLDKKKQIDYKHLSSVVSKRKRFDFLSDFVPEKVRAGIAIAEISSAKT